MTDAIMKPWQKLSSFKFRCEECWDHPMSGGPPPYPDRNCQSCKGEGVSSIIAMGTDEMLEALRSPEFELVPGDRWIARNGEVGFEAEEVSDALRAMMEVVYD